MENKKTRKVVLGVAAHSDDLDFSASGTFAKFAHDGYDCYYLILTDSSKAQGILKRLLPGLLR